MEQTQSETVQTPPRRTGRRWPSTFAALRHRNYQLWFVGQAISLMGTWMQSVVQGWLVYQLTGSEFALGTVSFAGSIPTLFFMLPAGVLADRVPRRRLMVITQSVMMAVAFVLAVLAATGLLRVWHIVLMAFILGIATSFDAPARLSLAVDMVEDRRDLANAIALNSSMFNMARIVGPSIGGVLLATVGAAWCYALNGVSFLFVIAALLMMRFPAVPPRPTTGPLFTQLAAGVRYVVRDVPVRTIIVLLAVTSLFGLAYGTLLPAFAVDILKVDAAGLGALNTGLGVGALIASLTVAYMARYRRQGLLLTAGSLIFPLAVLGFSATRSLVLALVALAVTGFGIVSQNASCNTLVQTLVPDELRGRVMGVYSLMFFGAAPFGALLAGGLAQTLGTATAVAIGAAVNLAFALAALIVAPVLRRVEI
jgi:MFS family permease